jgi:hypothetical protein
VIPVKEVMTGSIGADGCWNAWNVSMMKTTRSSAQMDQEPTIMVRQSDATMQPPPQDHQLVSKRRVLSFKP